MRVIDASNSIVGRLAPYVAKLALAGEKVAVVNCEKAVISGNKKQIFEKYLKRRTIGDPFHGPYFPKQPDRILRKAIRGMLPHQRDRGRTALRRVDCYLGIPRELASQTLEFIEDASVTKLSTSKYITLKQLSVRLGARNG